MKKTTLVVGASPKPSRYAYKAVMSLVDRGHPVYAYAKRKGDIQGVPIHTEWPSGDVDTVTLYLNPDRQQEYYQKIIDLKPKHVIFNPGTENQAFQEMLVRADIRVEVACTLVMLRVGNY